MEQEAFTKNPANKPEEKSWGDRFKRFVFGASTHAGLNGVVNLVVSALVAYAIELRYRPQLESGLMKMSNWVSTHLGGNSKRLGAAFYSGMMAVTLGIGGWLLLAPIKWLEDRRHRLEFKIGHSLDRLQKTFGLGNSASKANLADYDKINTAMHETIEFTPEEKKRFDKHHIDIKDDGKLTFREHRLPWYKIITSRLIALVVTDYGAGAVFGYTGLTKKLEDSSPRLTKAISAIFPSYNKIFKDPNLFSKLLAADVLLTATVAGVHKITQDILHHEPKETKHKKIIAEGRKSYTARHEELKLMNTELSPAT